MTVAESKPTEKKKKRRLIPKPIINIHYT